jgi:hypothetical protein
MFPLGFCPANRHAQQENPVIVVSRSGLDVLDVVQPIQAGLITDQCRGLVIQAQVQQVRPNTAFLEIAPHILNGLDGESAAVTGFTVFSHGVLPPEPLAKYRLPHRGRSR